MSNTPYERDQGVAGRVGRGSKIGGLRSGGLMAMERLRTYSCDLLELVHKCDIRISMSSLGNVS
jgi:hypothetical protein